MNKEANRIVQILVFVGEARPAHDSMPLARVHIKQKEATTLKNMIARYLRKCLERQHQPQVSSPKGRPNDNRNRSNSKRTGTDPS